VEDGPVPLKILSERVCWKEYAASGKDNESRVGTKTCRFCGVVLEKNVGGHWRRGSLFSDTTRHSVARVRRNFFTCTQLKGLPCNDTYCQSLAALPSLGKQQARCASGISIP
jgi:hypothetical protein